MKRWLAALLLLAFAPSAQAQRASDSIGVVTWAAYAEHRLWFVAGDRGLYSIEPEAGDEVVVAFDHGVVGAAYVQGFLWVAQDRPPESNDTGGATMWRLQGQERVAFARFDERDPMLAFTVWAGAPAIRTQTALRRYDPGAQSWRRVTPPEETRRGSLAIAATRNGDLYTGLDAGEWGGSLVRFAPSAGGFGRDLCTHDACGGPVRKLIADPSTDDCVIAAISLQHRLLSVGRVLRVCGDQTNALFERPLPRRRQPTDALGSEAVLDIAASARGIWVETTRGLYLISRNGYVRTEPAPQMRQAGRVWIGRLPGLYVIASGRDASDVSNPPYLLAPAD